MCSKKSYFFCGIGGSGMLSLALISQSYGYKVSGSDRSYDQGKNKGKFSFIQNEGIILSPQDGSGLSEDVDAVIVSTAVEDHIPDIKRAKELNIPIIHRAAFLASLFNKAPENIAIAGTSGKTTTTGMVGYVLRELGRNPTVMNGGVFRNYAPERPYGSALTGAKELFVSECDESDGSIALYAPNIAILNNVALDHKPLEELKKLFGDFIAKSKYAIVNHDNNLAQKIAEPYADKVISFALESEDVDLKATDIILSQNSLSASISYKNETAHLELRLPGRHNLSNALASIGALLMMDIPLKTICETLAGFEGIKRRMEIVGSENGITVIDDFAHNPDKITASLKSLKNFPGRLIVFFQPHGFGFLKLVHQELAETFSQYLENQDHLFLVNPYYAGGTVDRSITSQNIIDNVTGINAHLCEDRDDVQRQILQLVEEGDRVIIMGARDDTLSDFAQDIFTKLPLPKKATA